MLKVRFTRNSKVKTLFCCASSGSLGQGPTAPAVGAGGGCEDIFFSLVFHFSFLSSSLWETARDRLKYCLKGPLSPKQQTNKQFRL